METKIIDTIPLKVDFEALCQSLRIRPDTERAAELKQLVEQAELIARPKAMYRLGFIEEKGEDYIVVDGLPFKSRILRVNVGETQRVFFFIATCGEELDSWSSSRPSMILRYYADVIQEIALRQVSEALAADIEANYRPGQTAMMTPGSLDDFPLSEQMGVFAMLGDPRTSIGVDLNDSYLMKPMKSVAGVMFSTQFDFESCQLCPREVCQNRRSPYQPELLTERYVAH
ncbi:MAG: hypothetical protein JXB38_15050 [Anaerolineales bacterium]|nr:hypothetical protein [Anaerolineales bacterium]